VKHSVPVRERFLMRRALPLLLMLGLTAALMVATAHLSLRRYHEFRSGWSWDLAYYNQWFWALNQGAELTVRPIGPWTEEGPSVWNMNYLTPIRLAIAPFYRLLPGPETLLVIQSVAIWLAVPAAFGLVKFESGSPVLALSATALVPLTPLLWPLAFNDFRELQLAPAFALWAVHGVRARNLRLAVLGIGGLLACRQEFALLVASLALLPPREPEDVASRYCWARGLWVSGWGWLLIGFLGYSRWVVNSNALEIFVGELTGSHAPIGTTVRVAAELLLVGMGSWALLACWFPRGALLALPWILSVAGGRWQLSLIGTEHWHHVRYTAPMVAMVLAAGCLGYARFFRWLAGRRITRRWLTFAVWLALAGGCLAAGTSLESRFCRIPRPISSDEARALWGWIGQVGLDDGVLAHYEVAAPLSSRRRLYGYVMDQNFPPGFPNLVPEIQWVFSRVGDRRFGEPTKQGFRLVHDGLRIRVYHRNSAGPGTLSLGSETRSSARKYLVSRKIGTSWMERLYDSLGEMMWVLSRLGVTALFLVPGLGLIVWSRRRIDAFAAGVSSEPGPSGAEVSAAIRRAKNLPVVAIRSAEGRFADYYDRQERSIRLSASVAVGLSTIDRALAARETAYSLLDSRGDIRPVFRDCLVFTIRLGMLLGWVMMVAGVVLWSWSPIQAGALLVSLSVLVPFPALWLLERSATRVAARCLARLDTLPEAERSATVSALFAVELSRVAALGGKKPRARVNSGSAIL
jgi:Zn-dependent membrane protease YugP